MQHKFIVGAFAAALLLSGCATAPNQAHVEEQILPPPPPPPPDLAPMTDAVRALYGEWRLLKGPEGAPEDRLTIWSPAFAWGSGCNFSQGMLRDEGDGRFLVSQGSGGISERCRTVRPLAPFEGGEVRIALLNSDKMRIERGSENWTFGKVDVAASIPGENFVRGEWLLADENGRPLRGRDLTLVHFTASEYSVETPDCRFWANGWIPERDNIVRPGGNIVSQKPDCNARTLGDRLAMLGEGARFIADPVETRLTVMIGRTIAVLVPAARYPELAREAAAVPPAMWPQELANAFAKMPQEQRDVAALRAIGLGGEGLPGIEQPADPRDLAFVGMTAWHYDRARDAGLLPAPGTAPATLRQHLATAPIVVRAVLEGIVPVDRSDGLALDYLYRVREAWRGGNTAGDLLIVRMPPLTGNSLSPVITPSPETEVLLLASRTGYIARQLSEGKPPSDDRRVVQMTLPLMRIMNDRLAEAVEGANVLGAAGFAGMPVEEARSLTMSVDKAMNDLMPPVSGRSGKYFITRVGDRVLRDPTRLWLNYSPDADLSDLRGLGGVTVYFDGCTPISFSRIDGKLMVFANAVACPGNLPDGTPVTDPAVTKAAQWINENNFPDVICTGGPCNEEQRYIVPLPDGDIELRPVLK